jgi:hypothetical protein
MKLVIPEYTMFIYYGSYINHPNAVRDINIAPHASQDNIIVHYEDFIFQTEVTDISSHLICLLFKDRLCTIGRKLCSKQKKKYFMMDSKLSMRISNSALKPLGAK